MGVVGCFFRGFSAGKRGSWFESGVSPVPRQPHALQNLSEFPCPNAIRGAVEPRFLFAEHLPRKIRLRNSRRPCHRRWNDVLDPPKNDGTRLANE